MGIKVSDYRELYESFSEYLTCPGCSEDVDIWTDEEKTRCLFCGFNIFRKEALIH